MSKKRKIKATPPKSHSYPEWEYVPQWNFSVVRGNSMGYTIDLRERQPNGKWKEETIPLLDLCWSDAEAVGKAVVGALQDKTVRLDNWVIIQNKLHYLQTKLKNHKKAQREIEADIRKAKKYIAKLKKTKLSKE